jgi:hypothetical protein
MRAAVVIVAADIAAWIGAAAAVLAIGIPFWVLRFRPRFSAKLDERRQGIRLVVDNRGRGSGRVNEVIVVNDVRDAVPSKFPDFPSGRFAPLDVPGRTKHELTIVAAKERGAFAPDVRLVIRWGRRETELVPDYTPGVSFHAPDAQRDA